MTATLTTPRERSRWEFCDKHRGWFAGCSRERIAETFVEGGPAMSTPGCEGGCCRLWPGRDFYCAEYCVGGEAALDWTDPLREAVVYLREGNPVASGNVVIRLQDKYRLNANQTGELWLRVCQRADA